MNKYGEGIIRFVIEQKLPTLNEYTLACRGNKYTGAKSKKDIENTIGWYIIKAKLPKVERAVVFPILKSVFITNPNP